MSNLITNCGPTSVYDNHDTNDTTSMPTRGTMMISPNLAAALEYDERMRTGLDTPGTPGPAHDTTVIQSGLPAPPRPKSRNGLRRAASPPPPGTIAPFSGPSESVGTRSRENSIDTSPPANATTFTSPWNPFINPPPRLTPSKVDENWDFPIHRRGSNTESEASQDSQGSGSRNGGQEKLYSPLQPALALPSPDYPITATPATGEARPSFQRHLRYLSSLPKVDKILGKGKSFGVGRSNEPTSQRRNTNEYADGEMLDYLDRDSEMISEHHRRMLEKGKTPATDGLASAPTSPVASHPDISSKSLLMDRRATDIRILRPTTATGDSITPDTPDTPQGPRRSVDSLGNRRPLSHARHHSATSSVHVGSESSHEPPSTHSSYDPRISISSTVYQASTYSIPYPPPRDTSVKSRSSGELTRRPVMDHHRESFMELLSPISPFSPDFSVNRTQDVSDPSTSYQSPSGDSDAFASPAKPILSNISISAKPPLPTTPKPRFDSLSNKRSQSAQPPHKRSAPPLNLTMHGSSPDSLPPTTNFLQPQERADRIRQNRKLAQVLGQTPAAAEVVALSQTAYQANPPSSGLLSAPSHLVSSFAGKRKHQRGAISLSVSPVLPGPAVAWPYPEYDLNSALSARRHSSPLSPVSFMDDLGSPQDGATPDDYRSGLAVINIGHPPSSRFRNRRLRNENGLGSPTSFMDLSDEDAQDDSSMLMLETPRANINFPSTPSLYSLNTVEMEEEERRRKREKLAKLHRFLGSRVPTDLVLSQCSPGVPLPPVAPVSAVEGSPKTSPDTGKAWMRRRRSSSAAEYGGKWSDDIDRLKEELNDREKAINVRRAVKMEKMFGVAPPQTLYHTRAVTPGLGSPGSPISISSPKSSPPAQPRNPNRSAYSKKKVKRGKQSRPGTADSGEPLIDSTAEEPHSSYNKPNKPFSSEIYEHYRHSLNSLNDIIDRDDTESLQRLHGIIHGDGTGDLGLQYLTIEEDGPPIAPSVKSERRRSLPSRTSLVSISSEFTVTTPPPDVVDFQTRRRRAAKLTQFFGVGYRDLMGEVIDSIEKGLQDESGKGTLGPDEVQELMHKLRKLKSKRNSLLV